ncbi:MAG TPA: membrane protein insertase YidC, partial [Terrimicrobiaceae bacterium]
MDRKAWIAIIFSLLGLVAWQWYYVKTYSRKGPPVAAEEAVTTPVPATTPTAIPTPLPEEPVIAARDQSLYSKSAEYVFSNNEGGIERAILLLHLGEDEHAVFLNGSRTMPIGAIGEKPAEPWGGFAMQIDPSKGEALFTRKDADGLEITKRFLLPETGSKDGPYVVRMELTFRNKGTTDVERNGYFVSAGGAAPIHANDLPIYTKFDWMHEGKFETIDVNWFNPSSIPLLGIPLHEARHLYLESRKDVTWTGVASQYFCTIVTTAKTKGISSWATRYDTRKLNNVPVYGIQGGLGMPAFRLAPGESLAESFEIYAGPKDLSQLRKLGGKQDAVMNFGMFGIVSEFLLWAMNGLNAIFNSYAAAIIVLTLVIKSLLWPIQNKATNQLRKMSLLSPKMTELREKYKDDPQKMNEEVMKLY